MSKENKILLAVIVVLFLVIVVLATALVQKQKNMGTVLFGEQGGLKVETTDWQDPKNPESSLPLEEKDIPKETIRIRVSSYGFSPNSFRVKKGEQIFLSVTSEDDQTHIFKFKDPSLSDVAIGVSSKETRAITFYAPSKSGEYEYFCDVPGHEARGEKGKMIVVD